MSVARFVRELFDNPNHAQIIKEKSEMPKRKTTYRSVSLSATQTLVKISHPKNTMHANHEYRFGFSTVGSALQEPAEYGPA